MTLWTRIAAAVSALSQGESLSTVFDHLRSKPERSVAFAIAIIALSAKMAKADGLVTRDEVTAFREVFHFANDDEAKAAQLFNLAREDVAGFETYARSIARMFRTNQPMLEDLLEGLFYIALADGEFHPKEDAFIHAVAMIFGLTEQRFHTLRTRFAPNAKPDAYAVLGVDPTASIQTIRKAWKQAVLENHPDRMIARGVPAEAIALATRRLMTINQAWEDIAKAKT